MVNSLFWAVTISELVFAMLVCLVTLGVRRLVVWRRNIGKSYFIELNSNNKSASVKLIHTTDREKHQMGDSTVKLEGDFCYIERDSGRRLFVVNGDTGKLIKATEGEAEEIDGGLLARFLGNRFLERIAAAGDGMDWARIAAIVGCVGIVGLIVIGFVLVKIMGSMNA